MQIPENHLLVIFGASGDLTHRKLVPALFNLFKQKRLPVEFAILGLGRTELNNDNFRQEMMSAILTFPGIQDKNDKTLLKSFISKLHYKSLDPYNLSTYSKLKHIITRMNQMYHFDNKIIFYMATPPVLYEKIPSLLASQNLNHPDCKLVIEKPFGVDYYSANLLNMELLKHFKEDQIYRIDHYLGKETVQNILVARFSNYIFEPLWNRNYIHHIEITSAESIGIEKRGNYYDNSGALRDMVQNHLLQLVGLIAMEPPSMADSNNIRNETLKVFQSLRPLEKGKINKDIIRGQYTSSLINNEKFLGYREEEHVNPESKTETYVALKVHVDNWRWQGVPFYIRTGKRLPIRVSEVVIYFKPTPHHLFCSQDGKPGDSNQLVIRIQPDEGLLLKFGMKVPGAGFTVQDVNMDFHYSSLGDVHLPEAYERLLLDCMNNDSTLFSRGDAVETTWQYLSPIQEIWSEEPNFPLYGYPAGTWGPDVADNLIEEPWIHWRYPCKNLANDGIYCEL